MSKKLKFSALILLGLLLNINQLWGAYTSVYTLTPAATGSNSSPHNAYASGADFDCKSNNVTIQWNVTGNSYMVPWRIGGKNTSNTDRAIYSKNAIAANVSKIEITHGSKSSGCTVNSMTVIVSTAQNGGGTVISTLTPTYVNNGTVTITRPADKDWTGRYYKIVYNYKSSSSSTNNYVLFSGATFYKTTYTMSYNANGGSGSMSDASSPYDEGATVTVKSNSFTAPSGKVFDHWDTKSDDSGTDYDPAATFAIGENTTLYAQWVSDGCSNYSFVLFEPLTFPNSSSCRLITDLTAYPRILLKGQNRGKTVVVVWLSCSICVIIVYLPTPYNIHSILSRDFQTP